MKRVRLVSVQITVQAFLDDGETLQPLNVSEAVIPANQLDEFPTLIRESLTAIEAQANQKPDGADES